MEAPMWQNVGPEIDHAIGPCVPRVSLETLRGTRGREWTQIIIRFGLMYRSRGSLWTVFGVAEHKGRS